MPVIDRLYEIISRPVPAQPLGFVRILIGVAAAVRALEGIRILWPLTRPETLRLPNASWLPEPSHVWVAFLLGTWLLAALAFAVGWRTRLSGAVLAATLAAVLLLDQQAYSNHLYLMFLLVTLLTVSDSGASLSVDARGGERPTVPAGPVLLMKVQISIVYGFAAFTKLNGGFLSGHVVAAQIGNGLLPVPAELEVPVLMTTVSVLVVALEAFLALGLWSKRLRPAALVAGLFFHVAIVALMAPTVQLAVFAAEVLAVYLLFLDLEPGSRMLVFDEGCGFCTTLVRRLRALDWLSVLRPVARAESIAPGADDGIELMEPEGRWDGYEALGRSLETLPVTFLAAPLHRLLVRRGGLAFQRLAKRSGCRGVTAGASSA